MASHDLFTTCELLKVANHNRRLLTHNHYAYFLICCKKFGRTKSTNRTIHDKHFAISTPPNVYHSTRACIGSCTRPHTSCGPLPWLLPLRSPSAAPLSQNRNTYPFPTSNLNPRITHNAQRTTHNTQHTAHNEPHTANEERYAMHDVQPWHHGVRSCSMYRTNMRGATTTTIATPLARSLFKHPSPSLVPVPCVDPGTTHGTPRTRH
ncbi:hypothetical protein BDV93DRAFT_360437 [Ceratobasidium sp. AG-I]|nr:hypothetical protein BDV93DRAFT_360437 [Ceratobasidium sp. AG-I]